MQFVITDAGITAIINAGISGPKIEIINFKFGSAVNYTPLSSQTALQGAVVGSPTGYPVSGYSYISPNISEWKLIIDETVGNFQFGEVALYIDDPGNPGNDLMFAIAAFPSYVQKYDTGTGTPNRVVMNARCAYTNLSPVVNYTLNTMYAAALVELPGVHALVAPGNSGANQYLCHTADDSGKHIFVYKTDNDVWSINDFYRYITGTVTAGTNTQLALTSTAISNMLNNGLVTFAAGRFLVQITSGPHIGMIRAISATSNNFIEWTDSFSAAITVGTTFQIYISDYYQSLLGDVPTPVNPTDNYKVLTANGGTYGWVTATTVPVPASPADNGKVLGATGGGSYGWVSPVGGVLPTGADTFVLVRDSTVTPEGSKWTNTLPKTVKLGATGVTQDSNVQFFGSDATGTTYSARILVDSVGKMTITPTSLSYDALLLDGNVRIADNLQVDDVITGLSTVILKGYIVVNSENASNGGQLVLAYPNISGLTGEANSTWNVDVDSGSDFRVFRKDSGGVTKVGITIDNDTGYTYGVTPPDDDSSTKFATTEWVSNQNQILSMLARDSLNWDVVESLVATYYWTVPYTPQEPLSFHHLYDTTYTSYIMDGSASVYTRTFSNPVSDYPNPGSRFRNSTRCPKETFITGNRIDASAIVSWYSTSYRVSRTSVVSYPGISSGGVAGYSGDYRTFLYGGYVSSGLNYLYNMTCYAPFNEKSAPNNVHLSATTVKHTNYVHGYSHDNYMTMTFPNTPSGSYVNTLHNIYLPSIDRFRCLDFVSGNYLQSTTETGVAWGAPIANTFGDLSPATGHLASVMRTEGDMHIGIHVYSISPTFSYRFVYSTPESAGLTWVAVYSSVATSIYPDCCYLPSIKRILFYDKMNNKIIYSDIDTNNEPGPFITMDVVSPNVLPESRIVYSSFYNRLVGYTALSSNYVKFMLSSDGLTWSTENDMEGAWETVTWAAGSINKFVLASQNGYVAYSPSLESWARVVVAGTWNDSTFSPSINSGAGQVVIVGTNDIKYSANVTTWTSATGTGVNANDWKGVAWSPEQATYLAVANGKIAHSTNGTSWTVVTPSISFNGFKTVWCSGFNSGNGYWLTLATNGANYRANDITIAGGWTANTTFASGSSWRAIAYSPLLNRAVATGNGYIAYTDNGTTWTLINPNPVNTNTWESVVWSPTLQAFYAIGNGKIIYSVDGTLWQSYTVPGNWQDITYSPLVAKFVAVTQNKLAVSRYGGSNCGCP